MKLMRHLILCVLAIVLCCLCGSVAAQPESNEEKACGAEERVNNIMSEVRYKINTMDKLLYTAPYNPEEETEDINAAFEKLFEARRELGKFSYDYLFNSSEADFVCYNIRNEKSQNATADAERAVTREKKVREGAAPLLAEAAEAIKALKIAKGESDVPSNLSEAQKKAQDVLNQANTVVTEAENALKTAESKATAIKKVADEVKLIAEAIKNATEGKEDVQDEVKKAEGVKEHLNFMKSGAKELVERIKKWVDSIRELKANVQTAHDKVQAEFKKNNNAGDLEIAKTEVEHALNLTERAEVKYFILNESLEHLLREEQDVDHAKAFALSAKTAVEEKYGPISIPVPTEVNESERYGPISIPVHTEVNESERNEETSVSNTDEETRPVQEETVTPSDATGKGSSLNNSMKETKESDVMPDGTISPVKVLQIAVFIFVSSVYVFLY